MGLVVVVVGGGQRLGSVVTCCWPVVAIAGVGNRSLVVVMRREIWLVVVLAVRSRLSGAQNSGGDISPPGMVMHTRYKR